MQKPKHGRMYRKLLVGFFLDLSTKWVQIIVENFYNQFSILSKPATNGSVSIEIIMHVD